MFHSIPKRKREKESKNGNDLKMVVFRCVFYFYLPFNRNFSEFVMSWESYEVLLLRRILQHEIGAKLASAQSNYVELWKLEIVCMRFY